MVYGAGTGTSDSNLRWLSNGEFVVNAEATRRNRALLESINSNDRLPSGSYNGSAGGASYQMPPPIVNIYGAPEGTKATARLDDRQYIIDVVIGDTMGDGQIHQTLSGKYGLSTVGA
ncbi:hypothetical protein D3C84_924960 [compost metagenome]